MAINLKVCILYNLYYSCPTPFMNPGSATANSLCDKSSVFRLPKYTHTYLTHNTKMSANKCSYVSNRICIPAAATFIFTCQLVNAKISCGRMIFVHNMRNFMYQGHMQLHSYKTAKNIPHSILLKLGLQVALSHFTDAQKHDGRFYMYVCIYACRYRNIKSIIHDFIVKCSLMDHKCELADLHGIPAATTLSGTFFLFNTIVPCHSYFDDIHVRIPVSAF